MSRLTQRNEQGTAYYYPTCFEKCDGLGYSMRCDKCELNDEICDKLGKYEDDEEQGLLLKLPCKVGDTVWFVGNDFVNDYEVRRYIIDETGVECIQIAKEIDGRDYWNSFTIDDFNKTIFLSKEEAEQKLKEMESDTNGKN